jgi:flagella basal body P-ring formation protein FlgA
MKRRLSIWLPLFIVACLGAGFAVHLSASEPSISTPPIAAPRQHTLAEADVLSLLTATLQRESVKDLGELELRTLQPWKSVSVPDGPLTLRLLDLPNMGVTSAFIVRFELCATNQTLGAWQLPVQGHIWREVWVARSPLKRGELVCDSDVARERRDILSLHEPLAEFAAGDTTLEIAESVQAGTPLLARCVRAHPVMRRGQMADALVQDGTLSITLKVEVLQDGVPGQIIRVRNAQTRRDILGKVLNDQTLIVSR